MPFSKIKNQNQPHLLIDAGPGSGKTTTMIAGLNIMQGKKPSWYKQATDEQKVIWKAMEGDYSRISFQAFNKAIATELQEKVPANVEAKTFHAFGFSMLMKAGFKFKPSGDDCKLKIKITMGYEFKDRMKRPDFELSLMIAQLIGLCKNNLLEPTTENLLALIKHNNIEVNGNLNRIQELVSLVMTESRNIKRGEFQYIDFDDMIWLPIVLDLDFSDYEYDLLICDESQDLNPVQHAMIMKSATRLICVGDPNQAIYGFRGADANSMKTLEALLAATDRGVQMLPLQTTFRLPKSGVTNVNDFNPNLRPLPDAIEGTISSVYLDQLQTQPGDLIVSRINGNIFSLAFGLLKKRIPVRIQGREFADQLLKIINDNCKPTDLIDAALLAIQTFDHNERHRLENKQFAEKLLDTHAEKITCLYSLAEGCQTVKEMLDTMEQLFDQQIPREKVVLLATVHRAKGLESKRVIFLEPNLVPHPMAKLEHERKQEFNLKFVAETRHMEALIYVTKRPIEDDRDQLEGNQGSTLNS